MDDNFLPYKDINKLNTKPIYRSRPGRKRKDKDGRIIEFERKRVNSRTNSIDSLDSLYASLPNKNKKVCGKIVTPLDLLQSESQDSVQDENSSSSTNTDELIKNLIAEQSSKLNIKMSAEDNLIESLINDKKNHLMKHKHCHKHKEHCKKHKKRKYLLYFFSLIV